MRLARKLGPCLPKLIKWFEAEGRSYVWRRSRDWYVIMVSEFLLVRTRSSVAERAVKEILDYYPTPEALCSSNPSEVLAFLEGVFRRVGLVKRARWLYEAVCKLVKSSKDVCSYELRSLPGVGSYIEAVIRNRVCGEPKPFIDSNVQRVISRVYGGNLPLKDIEESMLELGIDVSLLCYALMDLAHAYCKPRKPRCKSCPLRECCDYAM